MGRRKDTLTESDEEDVLNDDSLFSGGISAFPLDDDEIDEEALLQDEDPVDISVSSEVGTSEPPSPAPVSRTSLVTSQSIPKQPHPSFKPAIAKTDPSRLNAARSAPVRAVRPQVQQDRKTGTPPRAPMQKSQQQQQPLNKRLSFLQEVGHLFRPSAVPAKSLPQQQPATSSHPRQPAAHMIRASVQPTFVHQNGVPERMMPQQPPFVAPQHTHLFPGQQFPQQLPAQPPFQQFPAQQFPAQQSYQPFPPQHPAMQQGGMPPQRMQPPQVMPFRPPEAFHSPQPPQMPVDFRPSMPHGPGYAPVVSQPYPLPPRQTRPTGMADEQLRFQLEQHKQSFQQTVARHSAFSDEDRQELEHARWALEEQRRQMMAAQTAPPRKVHFNPRFAAAQRLAAPSPHQQQPSPHQQQQPSQQQLNQRKIVPPSSAPQPPQPRRMYVRPGFRPPGGAVQTPSAAAAVMAKRAALGEPIVSPPKIAKVEPQRVEDPAYSEEYNKAERERARQRLAVQLRKQLGPAHLTPLQLKRIENLVLDDKETVAVALRRVKGEPEPVYDDPVPPEFKPSNGASGNTKSADVRRRVVLLDNLPTSTATEKLVAWGQSVGPVAGVKKSGRRASITFRNEQHAISFATKFARHMLDMSIVTAVLLSDMK